MVHCCVTKGIVEDQGPACGAFVVLPEPRREFIEVLQPRGLLVPQEVLFVELGKLGLIDDTELTEFGPFYLAGTEV